MSLYVHQTLHICVANSSRLDLECQRQDHGAMGCQVLRRAFRYHWRLWTLPEVREMLLAAGFDDVRPPHTPGLIQYPSPVPACLSMSEC